MSYIIIIVGCGATGSHIVTLLSQLAISLMQIKEIVLIDGDKVEEKNFINQKFTAKDVGKFKSQVLSNRYSKLGINIGYIDKYISNENDLIDIILKKKNDHNKVILVGAVDNNKARMYLHETFISDRVSDLIYIDTGNGDKEKVGQTVLGIKDYNTTVFPPVADYYPQILSPENEDSKDDYRCSQIPEHPQNFVTNVLSATTTFLMINNVILGIEIPNKVARFNADKIIIK